MIETTTTQTTPAPVYPKVALRLSGAWRAPDVPARPYASCASLVHVRAARLPPAPHVVMVTFEPGHHVARVELCDACHAALPEAG